jgi:hypothetical protein
MHFVHCQKNPSPKVGAIHQFTFRVNQFHFLWHVDLSQWFHGTQKLDFWQGPKSIFMSFWFSLDVMQFW